MFNRDDLLLLYSIVKKSIDRYLLEGVSGGLDEYYRIEFKIKMMLDDWIYESKEKNHD